MINENNFFQTTEFRIVQESILNLDFQIKERRLYLSKSFIDLCSDIFIGTLVFVEYLNNYSSVTVWSSKKLSKNECVLSEGIKHFLKIGLGNSINVRKVHSNEIKVAKQIILTFDNHETNDHMSLFQFNPLKTVYSFLCQNEVIEVPIFDQVVSLKCKVNSREITSSLHESLDKLSISEQSETINVSKSTFIVLPESELSIECKNNNFNSMKEFKKISFDEIGGVTNEVEEIKLFLELSLFHPEEFRQYGFEPPKGILLFGPPGTGKTMIAKAIAGTLEINMSIINGAEILEKYYGESEKRLRMIFDEAKKNSPSIIFVDEIDALCPKREMIGSESEKRVVATLLTLMDSISSKESLDNPVVFIGATNRPNSIDSALRRPGRFDREIEIGIPNRKQRHDILIKTLNKIPNNLTEEQIEKVSLLMHGYVGADISSLCKEAGLLAVNRKLESQKNNTTVVLEVTFDDVSKALLLVKPTAMREIYVDVPRVTWNDVGGQHEVKQKLKEAIIWPLQHPEVFERMGIRPPRGILMYGPPGCSKTLMAKALANESKLNFISVKSSDKWVGESEKAVKEIFRKARAASPSIIFFDEIDAIAGKRGHESGEGGLSDRVLIQLLNEMDGVEPLLDVTIVAATNRPDSIDSALLRPGRIDRMIYVSLPDIATRKEIFKVHLSKMKNNLTEEDIENLSICSSGCSGAEIAAICRESALETIKRVETLESDTPSLISQHKNPLQVEKRDFDLGLKAIQPQITIEMINYYEQYYKTHLS